jgi:hypothetical protein
LIELHLFEKGVQALEVGGPEAAVFFEPLGGFGERFRFEAAGAALRVLTAGDETGTFEDFEVFGDGGLGHGEGLCEFVDRGFARGEAGEDGATSGVGESGESGVEAVGGGHCITRELYNHLVIYNAE